MTLSEFTQFLGWCTAIHLGLLVFSALMLTLCKNWVADYHSRLFNLDKSQLPLVYLQFLALYKLFWLFFNLVPYLVLRHMIS
ncbi:hypothetical protein P2G88_12085 [Aliiglaciecola sp. CAU 1673]|uniref:DUF6868 family protein n=1 Tax=Aliiglaciecola sp. CAU 1673 TaxID=3032595 RepID=UPI0023DA21C2|nr:hypothetical protein [Aliiglaciecola sp. CAU 1673]MDF2178990.1 hypothetical protein [Aliiglaciecola sp. CAU 1673]